MTPAFNESVVCPILIGRTADLTAFHLLVDQAKNGKGQVALLGGEAGVGKSRLVEEVKTYAANQGFLLLQGNCFQTDRVFPYAPFLDLLRSCLSGSSPLTRHDDLTPFAQELSQFLSDVTPLIPGRTLLMVPASLEPQQEKRRLFALLLHFLRSRPRANRCCSSLKISTGATKQALNSCCTWRGDVSICPSFSCSPTAMMKCLQS